MEINKVPDRWARWEVFNPYVPYNYFTMHRKTPKWLVHFVGWLFEKLTDLPWDYEYVFLNKELRRIK